jgi:hypothetical protein
MKKIYSVSHGHSSFNPAKEEVKSISWKQEVAAADDFSSRSWKNYF